MTKEAASKRRKPWLRLGLLAVLIGSVYVIGKTTGVVDDIDVDTIRETVNEAGALGFFVYVLSFALGVVVQVPGMLFVAAGILIYGKLVGYAICLVGSIVAVCASFMVVRIIGGTPLDAVERPFVRRLLDRLEQHPIRSLVLLRLVMFIAPPLNYALALSSIRFRDYAIGSALGLIAPMAVVTLVLDWLLQTQWVSRLLFG